MLSDAVDDSTDDNVVFEATYHDVQIKYVEIVNPSNTVKFEDSKTNHNEKPTLKQILKTNSNDDNERKLENYDEYVGIMKTSNNNNIYQDKPVNEGVLPVVTIPMKTPNELRVESKALNKVDPIIENHNEQKIRHREELLQRKQEIINSITRFTKRSSAKPRKKSAHGSKYYEVSPGVIIPERPISRVTSGSFIENRFEHDLNARASTVPNRTTRRVWTGKRSASSRPISSFSSSRFRFDEQMAAKPNLFVKMPFKQVPVITLDKNYKVPDELILPNEEMRVTTAFTVSRVRHAINRQITPSRPETRQGRLLKARLKPLEPVSHNSGPRIYSCQGIQPERRKKTTSSPPPSRLRRLKEQYLEMCKRYKENNTIENEYMRRLQSTSPDQSIHPPSPQPDESEFLEDEFQLQKDSLFGGMESTVDNTMYEKYARNTKNNNQLASQMGLMRLERNVIY